MRFFLGVGKYTPNLGVSGDMGWIPANLRQWKVVANYWARLSTTNSSRTNKRIALWANSKSTICKNWFYFVRKQLCDLNLIQYSDFSTSMSKHAIVKSLDYVSGIQG